MNSHFDYKLFGLEPRDMLLYEAMLKDPEGTSVRSLADTLNMNRGTTFETIKKLQLLGLVTAHYKNRRKYYVAQSPASLQRFAETKHEKMSQELGNIEAYVAKLKTLQAPEPLGQFGQVYEGEEEIALLLHDVLDEVAKLPSKTYRVISSAEISNHLYRKFVNFTRQRIKRGIHARVIGIGGGDKLAALAERKWLTTDEIPACYIIIYGSKVAHISLSRDGGIRGSVVDNPGVSRLEQLLFDKLWESLP